MYKVIRAFQDLTDNNRLYKVGDTFPAEGVKVSKARIKSLLDGSNKNGKVYLEEIEDGEPAKTGEPDPANGEPQQAQPDPDQGGPEE